MDRSHLLDALATGHAVALRLRAAGCPDDVIGVALGIPREAVPAAVRLAEAKLAALADDVGAPGGAPEKQ